MKEQDALESIGFPQVVETRELSADFTPKASTPRVTSPIPSVNATLTLVAGLGPTQPPRRKYGVEPMDLHAMAEFQEAGDGDNFD